MHIRPMFAVTGALASFLFMAWLLPAGFYTLAGRKSISPADVAMFLLALIVAIVIITPDDFFVRPAR
jgi:hypothetical protein